MLVVCPCGKKLNVADTLVGKKVRCPVCKEAFLVQTAEGPEKASSIVPKEQAKPRSADAVQSKQRPPVAASPKKARLADDDEADLLEEYVEDEPRSSSKKRQGKARPADDDDDLLEEYMEDQPRSSSKKPQGKAAKKSGTGLVRTIIGSVVLAGLLIGLAVVLWMKLQAPGTVTFDVRPPNYSVWVDGKEIAQSKSSDPSEIRSVILTLSPGDHEIKFIKEGFNPYQKQVTITSGCDDKYTVFLVPSKP
jgi:hypothetical protein